MSSQENLTPVSSSNLPVVEHPSTSLVLTEGLLENNRAQTKKIERLGDEMSAVKAELAEVNVRLQTVEGGQKAIVEAIEVGNAADVASFGSLNTTLTSVDTGTQRIVELTIERVEMEKAALVRKNKLEDEDRADARALKVKNDALNLRFKAAMMKWVLAALAAIVGGLGAWWKYG